MGRVPRSSLALTAAVLAASVLLPAEAAAPAPRAASPPLVAPFDRLPQGPPPTAVPYAIGTSVYYRGRAYDLSRQLQDASDWREGREFARVVRGRNGVVITEYVDVENRGVVARFSPTLAYRVIARTPFGALFDVTAGGLVTLPVTGAAVSATTGRVYARWPLPRAQCGYTMVNLEAAGASILASVTHEGACPRWTWDMTQYLWYPGKRPLRTSSFVAVGRWSPGWIARSGSSDCSVVVPAAAPRSKPWRFCSSTRPLVSPDGRYVVVVQAGRVRILTFGTTTNRATPLAIDRWDLWGGSRWLKPDTWLSGDAFLVNAKYGSALALMTCSLSTAQCRRVVRTSARTGVSTIVTERAGLGVLG